MLMLRLNRFLALAPRFLPAIALAGSLLAASPAPAQFGSAAGIGEVMSPYYFRRDLQLFVDNLQLDSAQADILETLFFEYEREHDSAKDRMMERIQNLRTELENLDRSKMLEVVFEPFLEKARHWENLRSEFLLNVQSILSTEQLGKWNAFAALLRREKEIPKGEFSGEAVDLMLVLRQMDLSDDVRSSAEVATSEYVTALDQALITREHRFNDARATLMLSMRDEDTPTALRIHEEQVAARLAVRDVNDQFVETIGAALPAEFSDQFRRAALEIGYPRVFRPTAAERVFGAALKMEGISEETLAAIVALNGAFRQEITDVNRQLVEAIRRSEPELARARAQSFAERGSGSRQGDDVETRNLFTSRDEIGRRYVELLRDLLTPEQFATLPGGDRLLRRGQMPSGLNEEAPDGEKGERMKRSEMKRQNAAKLRTGGNPRLPGSGGGGEAGGGGKDDR